VKCCSLRLSKQINLLVRNTNVKCAETKDKYTKLRKRKDYVPKNNYTLNFIVTKN